MLDKINRLIEKVEAFNAKNTPEIEEFRIKMLGKKGELNALLEEFKTVAPEAKREIGQRINLLKTATQQRVNLLKERAQTQGGAGQNEAIDDMTRPALASTLGGRHPISITRGKIIEIFDKA